MSEIQKGPKKVKVTVINNEKLPTTIDLKEDLRPRREEAATNQISASTEPDWKDKYLRLAAELDNSKKRLEQTYKQEKEREKKRLLADFLEVADNLERALVHAEADPDTLIEGTKTIQRQLQHTLAKHGVQPFNSEGQPFDPEQHEAVGIIRQPDLPPNTVAQVAQTGYTLGDDVLRVARVIVTTDP